MPDGVSMPVCSFDKTNKFKQSLFLNVHNVTTFLFQPTNNVVICSLNEQQKQIRKEKKTTQTKLH